MKFMHKHRFVKVVCLILLPVLLAASAAGCVPSFSVAGSVAVSDIVARGQPVLPGIIPTLGEYDFDIFLDEVFADAVTSDSLTLNFFLAEPSQFGIEDMEVSLGEVTTLESIHRGF